ncbi:MAG: hypothetical protein ACE5FS_09070 [Paracoccaceae bacterium]
MTYAGREKTSHLVKRLGSIDDLPGGGQVVVEGNYAYVGHMDPPHGTSIIDVSDPAHPRVVSQLMLEGDASHTHKVRVVGDLMYVNVEQSDRHFKRKSAGIADAEAALAGELGRKPEEAEIAARLGIDAADMPRLRAALAENYRDGGFKVYDVSDKADPREILYHRTFGFGVHRFDADESHAYISTEAEGYVGNILIVYDMSNPTAPHEVARWWIPGQHIAGGEVPTWQGYKNRLHHAMRVGDELWASYWQAGMRVLDISDITRPRLLGAYDYHPAIPEPTHTVMPLENPIGGRRYAVAGDEEHTHRHGALHGFMWVLDVTELADIRAVSAFDVSERDSPWARAGGRFGAHQFREKLDSTLVYLTWFAGGLRIVDVADPYHPEEVGHFIPQPRQGFPSPQSNDVDVDERGLIHVIDRNRGFDILEFDPP